MKISDVDKAKIGELVLQGKFEEAKILAEQTKKSAEETLQTLQEKEQQIAAFLTHAPQEAKDFFSTMSPEEQQDAMNTFRYNTTSIDILNAQGNIVQTMEKEDYTVPDSELIPGMIEKDEAGNTYFSFAAIENDELIPTDDDWEEMLKLMPAGDYAGKFTRCRAGKQLHALLGGKLSGVRSGGYTDYVGEYGYFQSRSVYISDYAFALCSDKDEGELNNYDRTILRPVRRVARTIS